MSTRQTASGQRIGGGPLRYYLSEWRHIEGFTNSSG